MNFSRPSIKIAAAGLSALTAVGVTAYAASAQAAGASGAHGTGPASRPPLISTASLCSSLSKVPAHAVCDELGMLARGHSLAGEHLVWFRTTYGQAERFIESVPQLRYAHEDYGVASEIAFGRGQKLHASDVPANRAEIVVEVWGPVTVGQMWLPTPYGKPQPVTAGHVALIVVDPVTGAIPLYGIAQPHAVTPALPYQLPA